MPRQRNWRGTVFTSAILVAAVPSLLCAQVVPVGGEFQVNTYTTNAQRYPAVAADADGDFVVVWMSRDQDGSAYGVFGRRYDSAGVVQGGEFQVNTYTTNAQRDPAVAADTAGAFVVVWTSYQDGSSSGVFGRRYDSAGAAQGGEFQVNTYTNGNQFYPAVAADAAGDFVVVWQSVDQEGSNSGLGVFGRRYDSAGAAQGGEFQVNTYTINDQFHAAVAADADGDFVVVWQSLSQDGFAYGVFGQRYNSAGAAQGGEFQVNTYTTGDQSRPAVAADADGDFVVVWASSDQDGFGSGVFGQRYNSAGTAQGGEFQVNTYTTQGQVSPAVAAGATGDFVVVWTSSFQDDGFASGVFGQRYDSAGAAQGGEFQVNTYTTSAQAHAAVAADAAGDFVVAWQSYQDGSIYGVFGQRYGVLGGTPTDTPSNTPTVTPTDTPTVTPTNTPTSTPTDTGTPTDTPTATPTNTPTRTPTDTGTPTDTPTVTPTNTPTSTPTETGTPTDTPTVTPTNTGAPDGQSCVDSADCISGNCVDDVCCGEPACPPGQSCDNPGNAGVCSADPTAPAPALSRGGVLLAFASLLAVGALAVWRRRQV